jgi:ubiquinone/menaquinone biosynthesis C-methylase UbiE
MKPLKNWDNRTWLSSKRYISQFHKFIKRKTKFNKNTRVLDIGCGRANIISLSKQPHK